MSFLLNSINLNNNFYARQQLNDGNLYFKNKNYKSAEISWNNSIKIACNYSCYDSGFNEFFLLIFNVFNVFLMFFFYF